MLNTSSNALINHRKRQGSSFQGEICRALLKAYRLGGIQKVFVVFPEALHKGEYFKDSHQRAEGKARKHLESGAGSVVQRRVLDRAHQKGKKGHWQFD